MSIGIVLFYFLFYFPFYFLFYFPFYFPFYFLFYFLFYMGYMRLTTTRLTARMMRFIQMPMWRKSENR